MNKVLNKKKINYSNSINLHNNVLDYTNYNKKCRINYILLFLNNNFKKINRFYKLIIT